MEHASIWTHTSYWRTCSVLVNGEDHLAIVVLGTGVDVDPPDAAARWPPVADGCWKQLSIS